MVAGDLSPLGTACMASWAMEQHSELLPRLMEALAGKAVIGVAVGSHHTMVWTVAGELITFGNGSNGQLGHGELRNQFVPRRVATLMGKKVVRGERMELVPRLVERSWK